MNRRIIASLIALACIIAVPASADVPISGLPTVSGVNAGDIVPIVHSGTTSKATFSQIWALNGAYIPSAGSGDDLGVARSSAYGQINFGQSSTLSGYVAMTSAHTWHFGTQDGVASTFTLDFGSSLYAGSITGSGSITALGGLLSEPSGTSVASAVPPYYAPGGSALSLTTHGTFGIQSFTFSATTGVAQTVTLTAPTAFTSASTYIVTANLNGTANPTPHWVDITYVSATQFTLTLSFSAAVTGTFSVGWTAIGQ